MKSTSCDCPANTQWQTKAEAKAKDGFDTLTSFTCLMCQCLLATQSPNGQRGPYVIKLPLGAGGRGDAPDGIAAPSGASTLSRDRRRDAFGHVVCADVDALGARPPSEGRQILPQSHQFSSRLLFQRSSGVTDVPWRRRQQYALLLHSRVSGRSVYLLHLAG